MKTSSFASFLLATLMTVAGYAYHASGYAASDAAPAKVSDGVLAGPNGMTLYTFDRDTAGSGKSVCNGPCTAIWFPLMADESDKSTGDYTVIVRDDGKKQWAYKGKPLYYWSKDTKPGERSGEGFNNLWRTARP